DLIERRVYLQREAKAPGSTHAQRVPPAGAGQPHVGLAGEDEGLIAWRGLGRASRGEEDVVRLFAVRDDRRLLGDMDARTVAFHGADAAAQVASGADFRRRRR